MLGWCGALLAPIAILWKCKPNVLKQSPRLNSLLILDLPASGVRVVSESTFQSLCEVDSIRSLGAKP